MTAQPVQYTQQAFIDMSAYDGAWYRSLTGKYDYFDFNVFVFYYDCSVDLDTEPQYHHYHCGREECQYCQAICAEMNKNSAYTLDDYISYERFLEEFPIDEDGSQDDVKVWQLHESYYDQQDEEEDEEEDEEVSRAGEIVDPSDYAGVDNAWIAPNGDLHFVPDYERCGGKSHDYTAGIMGFSGSWSMERAGYIHVSSYMGYSDIFHYVPEKPTYEQIMTSIRYCDANGLDRQAWMLPETEETSEYEIKSFVFFNVYVSCMSRSIRDRFYRLSGD